MIMCFSGPINFIRVWVRRPRVAWGLLLHKPEPSWTAEGVAQSRPRGLKLMWRIFWGHIRVHVHARCSATDRAVLVRRLVGRLGSGQYYAHFQRGCGGPGRRAALRTLWEQSRGGSSPLIRINFIKGAIRT